MESEYQKKEDGKGLCTHMSVKGLSVKEVEVF